MRFVVYLVVLFLIGGACLLLSQAPCRWGQRAWVAITVGLLLNALLRGWWDVVGLSALSIVGMCLPGKFTR